VGAVGGLDEILFGPSRSADGTTNLVGALRRAMATTGYLERQGVPARRGRRRPRIPAPVELTLSTSAARLRRSCVFMCCFQDIVESFGTPKSLRN
jgi:hypothetical protein